jgi:hypothetical protein
MIWLVIISVLVLGEVPELLSGGCSILRNDYAMSEKPTEMFQLRLYKRKKKPRHWWLTPGI